MNEHLRTANDRAGALLNFARIMKRFSQTEQNNTIAAMRSMYCCRVQKYSFSMYIRTLSRMTVEEQASVIDYVRKLWP